ncbi:hatching enzyme 1.2-like [Acipenser ruthenus]|uniref:hatching enzyme 1.2-like n=1 Tax=Acipenser ruthenus TaxID=7906 RepID=UPI0027403CC0|nr:hatching enzyme 1.2-like [Acipenser ruthenus]
MGRTLVLAMVAVLLPSLSQGNPLQEKYNVYGESQGPESKDIFTRILEANRGILKKMMQGDIAVSNTRSAMKCEGGECLWPRSDNGLVNVPYSLSDTYSDGDKNVIREAVKDFVDQTCIRFIERTTEKQYLNIMPDNGCWSYLGRKTMLAQPVSLTAGCMAKGSVQHELFHALGFYHEQSRSDRDEYVTIMWENIDEEYKYAFSKEDTNNLDTTYDYSSIMHYPSFAFTKSGNPTILPILNPERYIGQRVGMTATDIKKVNRLYQCDICNMDFSEMSGSFASTNHPTSYSKNTHCWYRIRVPDSTVTVTFDEFNLQSSPGCSSNYIRVYNEDTVNAPILLDKTCGNVRPPPVTYNENLFSYSQSGQSILVEYFSDAAVTSTGFKASYKSDKCHEFNLGSGSIYTIEKTRHLESL